MSELRESLRTELQDEEYRQAYADSTMNSVVAAQIKILREHLEMTQAQLAAAIGTKQAGISRLENVNYSSWKVETLRRIARAFRLRLRITFEEFGTLHEDVERFNKVGLDRRPFEEDPEFKSSVIQDEDLSKLLRDVPRTNKPVDGQRSRMDGVTRVLWSDAMASANQPEPDQAPSDAYLVGQAEVSRITKVRNLGTQHQAYRRSLFEFHPADRELRY